jgi:GNAT superfamily N-acetyltransferase
MTNNQACALPKYQKWVSLLDGGQAFLRPIVPDDEKAIVDLFYRLSAETRFLRFHYAKTKITPEELNRYCHVDYYNSFALVAEMERGGTMEIAGVGRYVRLPCSDIAEVAFVVEDKEQRKGIGTHLLHELSVLARERTVTTFVAELLNENIVMLDILRKFDPKLKMVVNCNSVLVTVST